MNTTYTDPAVSRLTRRRKPLPVWFWLVAFLSILLVTAASLTIFTGWSILHPLESQHERFVRQALEQDFRPVRVEQAIYNGFDEQRGWHMYRVKYWRPSPLGTGWVSRTADIPITPDGNALRR